MRYFLRTGTEYLEKAKPFTSKQKAVDAYAEQARNLRRFGQRLDGFIHCAEAAHQMKDEPDFRLTLTPRGAVNIERA
jgi:hypothetical protein